MLSICHPNIINTNQTIFRSLDVFLYFYRRKYQIHARIKSSPFPVCLPKFISPSRDASITFGGEEPPSFSSSFEGGETFAAYHSVAKGIFPFSLSQTKYFGFSWATFWKD